MENPSTNTKKLVKVTSKSRNYRQIIPKQPKISKIQKKKVTVLSSKKEGSEERSKHEIEIVPTITNFDENRKDDSSITTAILKTIPTDILNTEPHNKLETVNSRESSIGSDLSFRMISKKIKLEIEPAQPILQRPHKYAWGTNSSLLDRRRQTKDPNELNSLLNNKCPQQ
jgi:hypothetical protein